MDYVTLNARAEDDNGTTTLLRILRAFLLTRNIALLSCLTVSINQTTSLTKPLLEQLEPYI